MSQTGAEALRDATWALKAAGIEGAARDARKLLAWAVGISTDRLALALPEALDADQSAAFGQAVARRATGRPVSQITGRRAFYGRIFSLDEHVLDPRPETETLVELALSEPFERVLDLGTGTGCILLTLLAERPGAIGTGTDVSEAARGHAVANAMAHRLSDRAEIITANWFQGVLGRYDLITSNPPYISLAEMAGLDPQVARFEPHLALTDGADGLNAYRVITAGVMDHLTPGGRLIVEIGPQQAVAVAGLMAAAGLERITVHPDLDGRDRVVSGRRPAA